MTLEELFQRLSYGPLSNLALSNEGVGGIVDAHKPKVVLYINDALTRLHTRFLLVEHGLILRQVEGISNYELVPENTYTASVSDDPPEAIPYIQDTISKPFEDDLIKILKVYNCHGCEVPLNNEKWRGSYFTPENHVLQIPCPVNGELTHVVYQAKHKRIEFNPAKLGQTITIPPSLEEALTSYVAYLAYSAMNGQENVARATEYLSRYNGICLEVEARGISNTDDNTTNTKLTQRGFV